MVILLDNEAVKNDDVNNVLERLEQLTRFCQNDEKRSSLDVMNYKNLYELLDRFSKEDALKYGILVEAFRFLRNSVVACPRNQDLIREETKLVQATTSFLEYSCTLKVNENKEDVQPKSDEKLLLTIRCALQFLANFMVDNRSNINLISSSIPSLLGQLMCSFSTDEKIIQYGSMVVHLGLKHAPKGYCESPKILEALINNLHLEFVIYSMESLVKLREFSEVYDTLEPEERIKVLTFLNSRPDLLKDVNERVISTIKTNFIERSDFILRSKLADRDNLFCWEIAVLLEVLCVLSAEDGKFLRSDSVLLTTVLCLLRQIHEIGKDSSQNVDSVFSPVEDLAKLTSNSSLDTDVDDIRAHPTFQFKAFLIRLIANLCYRNKVNQDKVRELECLPIILDNCKIDARNPFIGQWSVLAIRNLCEGNEENQAYICEVQRVDTEKLLPKLDLVDLSK